MRMWNIEPELMCRQHLVAEHRELHMIFGTMHSSKKPSANYVGGLVARGLLNPVVIKQRHDELVFEMRKRGYKHKTPMPEPTVPLLEGNVCPGVTAYELHRRCLECRSRIGRLAHIRPVLHRCAGSEICLERMTSDFMYRPTDPSTGLAVAPES